MDRTTSVVLLGFGLAGLSAVIHLAIGLSGVYDWLLTGGALLLPVAFIGAAFLVIGLAGAYVQGYLEPSTVYATGAVLMGLHVLAYVDVHALGTVENVFGADVHDHGHDHSHDDHEHDDHDDHDDHEHDDHDDHDDHEHDDHEHDDHEHDDHEHDDHDGHDGHDDHDDHSHGHDHSHDGPAHEVVIDHLREDSIALVSKVSESIAAGAFLLGYLLERRTVDR